MRRSSSNVTKKPCTMVILEVYTKIVKVKYKSTLLSKATFLVLVCGMFSVILPFIFAYKSGGFWLKRDVYYEQPKINLRGEYLLIATTNNVNAPIICSTFPYYKQNLHFLDVCSIIKLREIDNNLDGKVDKIDFYIGLNMLGNKITSLNLVLPINYELNTVCPLRMQSAIIYQQYFQQALSSDLQVVGDLDIFQSAAFYCNREGYNFYNRPVIENAEEAYELDNIIEKYAERNVSTHLTNVYTNIMSGQKNKWKLKFSVRYPEHRIYYKPGLWQIMKWAWIQYLAVHIIISWFIRKIKNYVFNNRLVLFYEDSVKKNI